MTGTSTERRRGGMTTPSRLRALSRRLMLALALVAGAAAALCASASASNNPRITENPVSVTVEEPSSASFTAAATGAATVEWEVSTNGGSSFQVIPGATSDTYTIASTSVSESGHTFRATFRGAEGGGAITKAATLTVTRKPAITKQPVETTVQAGHEAIFEAAASGSPAPTVHWQRSGPGGEDFGNLSGQEKERLKLNDVSTSEDGSEYRAVFKNVAGAVTSEPAILHVYELPGITTQPSDETVVEGQTATFSAAGTGYPAPTDQWELSTNFGSTWAPIEGATSHEVRVPATTPSENGYEYRLRLTNMYGTTTSRGAKLTVQSRPVVTEQPESATVSPGGDATFKAEATGLPAPTVQWEVSLDEGGSWSPLSGATSESFTVSDAQLSESGREYRAAFTNSVATTDSQAATLTVSATDYRAYGWGRNDRGQTGTGSNEATVPSPTPIPGVKFVTAVAAGQRHGLALLAGGTLEAWGYDGFGQLGDEGAVTTRTPIAVENLSGVTAIAAGGNHSVALLKNGTVEDWGDDESGQLGDDGEEESEVPVQVKGLSGVTAIAAGQEHTLALLSNGTVMAWGNNEEGQLGTGSVKSSGTPVAVHGLSGVKAIAAKGDYSLALLSDGTVMAWGSDEHGQLGNTTAFEKEEEETEAEEGEGVFSPMPVPVEGLSGVSAIAAGATHALALLEEGTVVAWGDDRSGELGNGARETMDKHPVAVTGLSGVSSIAAGEQDSAALLSSGRLMTWGADTNGSLGTGTRGEPVDTPTEVTGLAMVAGVSAGGEQMIAFGEEGPSVSGLSPSDGSAAGGTEVTISGTKLTGATAVHFGTKAATSFEDVSANTVTAIAPAGTGTVDVTVTTPAGITAPEPDDRFTYLSKPAVSAISVKSGPATGGTVVTITGSGFTAGATVRFGEQQATKVTVNSAVSITATTPVMAAGKKLPVTVTTPGGTSAAAKQATFASTPVITGVSPASGPLAGGNTVTVSGAGFAPGANASKFKFGSAKVKSAECESITTCTVLVPAGKSAATVAVTVEASKEKSAASEGDEYTYE